MGKLTDFVPDDVDKHVGAKIRLRRKELRMSQEQLGVRCNVTFQQVQKYERAANRVSASRLVQVAAALSTTPGYFVNDAPGAPGALPEGDDWSSAKLLLASTPGALDALRSLAALQQEARAAVVTLMRAAAKHAAPRPQAAA